MNDAESRLKLNITQSIVMLVTIMAIVATVFCTSAFGESSRTSEAAGTVVKAPENVKWGLIAASVAFGMGAIGAGIAISHVGAAAMGAVAEKPQIAGQALIFVALAEGLVVFGFITALMILGKV